MVWSLRLLVRRCDNEMEPGHATDRPLMTDRPGDERRTRHISGGGANQDAASAGVEVDKVLLPW